MEKEPNTYSVTWETWHTMTGQLVKMEQQRDEAFRLIDLLLASGETPENLEKFIIWKKCFNEYEELKAKKEKHV
jgi:hypothetical protein